MDSVLAAVVDRYLSSGDFNGYHLTTSSELDIARIIDLINDGLLQVVDESDHMNIHIRPWPSRRSIQQQVESVVGMTESDYGVGLYPTGKAMAQFDLAGRFQDQPYARRMAEGGGTLELAYFKFDVLEPYRNDPRFSFRFNDYGADIGITDEVYLDESEPEDDKTSIGHVGFAYDLSEYEVSNPDSKIVRRVCAFLSDLEGLSEVHQQRWKTYEVAKVTGLERHPIWWRQQMGHWPDGMGPFERLFFELKTWNELHKNAFGDELLRVTDRPEDFGWIIRPSQQEYSAFVHQLDKLLSENIRHSALDTLGVAKKDDEDMPMGTLNRLDHFLKQRHTPDDTRTAMIGPLREIRRTRQGPAHRIEQNVTDSTFVHKQASLIQKVTLSVELCRRFWQDHPSNSGWDEPEMAKPDAITYWL